MGPWRFIDGQVYRLMGEVHRKTVHVRQGHNSLSIFLWTKTALKVKNKNRQHPDWPWTIFTGPGVWKNLSNFHRTVLTAFSRLVLFNLHWSLQWMVLWGEYWSVLSQNCLNVRSYRTPPTSSVLIKGGAKSALYYPSIQPGEAQSRGLLTLCALCQLSPWVTSPMAGSHQTIPWPDPGTGCISKAWQTKVPRHLRWDLYRWQESALFLKQRGSSSTETTCLTKIALKSLVIW